jgi:hypothetical protein
VSMVNTQGEREREVVAAAITPAFRATLSFS